MDKKNNKKLKQYKKKYFTKDRVDMSKGGRVKAQVGGIQQAPMSRRRPPMSIEREGEVQPTVQPITQAPVESKRPNVVQPQATPKDVTPVTETKPNQPTFQQAPTTGKGSDQMFIGREGAVQPQAAQAQTAVVNVEDSTAPMTREEFNRQYGDYEGPMRGSQAGRQRNEFYDNRQKDYEDYLSSLANLNNTTTATDNNITGTTEQFEAERAKRITQAGRTAEEIAAGTIPEGLIPQQEIVGVKEGEEYNVEIIELAERKGVNPQYVKEVGPEVVQQMEDISTVKTPEPIVPSTIAADTVAESVEVNTARGEVRDEALAKAVGVERIDPVEAVEVEIEPGALADRVVGVLSEEAKSTAAQVAGTSLPRITRAKKQLRNAGLSEEDIAELGNDPEALEARLTDFSEQQRGIIEGLPKEALVSNQLDSLLSGMENGEIPTWARPAVAQVEQMLAKRGMSASTVGRDALFNAIIQSAVPIAQSNAQAIQQSVGQQKSIEAQVEIQNAQLRQQTAIKNADKVFSLNMAQFSADQQTELSNSKFLQTVSITDANNAQKAVMQNAVLMSQANVAEASLNQQAQIQNAKNFLAMDMQNLSNQQQSNILQAQQEQQRILSNQAATNVAKQFNASSENQTRQFMASLNAQIEQFNAQQQNVAEQFNVQQNNAAEARRIGIEADINKANANIINQTRQFNEQIDFNRDQFNTQNALAIQQSNVEWRRKINLANTAAENAINQENAKMAFGLTSQAQAFLWQELRDQADYNFRWANDTATRKTQAMIAAASSEGDIAKNWSTNFTNISSTVNRIFGT
jgi:hypothetical protein